VDIFDRLGNLMRTILDDDEAEDGAPGQYGDPDERAAWQELEDFMRSESTTARPSSDRSDTPAMPLTLRKDFRNLEVPVGAPLSEVRAAYKRLMATFHPDRHSSDPEKLRTATEVTKKLNQSFQRIRTYYEGRA